MKKIDYITLVVVSLFIICGLIYIKPHIDIDDWRIDNGSVSGYNERDSYDNGNHNRGGIDTGNISSG